MLTIRGKIDNEVELFNPIPELVRIIKRDLSLDNPLYFNAIKHNRSTRGIPRKIRLYRELNGHLWVPRGYISNVVEYSEQLKFKLDLSNQTCRFEPKKLQKSVSLWDYQEPWVEDMLKFNQGLGCAPAGCHRKGTQILMADGTTKTVEDVKVGDRIMGMSGPRNVLSLCRGVDSMYRVSPVKGESFYVNGNHILSVIFSANPKGRGYKRGEIIDISVNDWLDLPTYIKHETKLFRQPVISFEGPPNKLPFDPYFLGVLLGDGGIKTNINVTTADTEIEKEVYRQADSWGLKVRVDLQKNNKSRVYNLAAPNIAVIGREKKLHNPNGMYFWLKKLGLYGLTSGDKFIPHIYKTSTISDRLSLLAGLLDTDGHLSTATFDYVSKSKLLAEDFCFISRSCGLAAYLAPKVINGVTYWRVSLSGDTSIIPTRIKRKQATPRRQKKSVLRTGFSIEKVSEKEDYYGFTVDGDHRYLLSDFTVTHNSGKTVCGLSIYAQLGQPCLWVTHTKRLATQTANRARELLGIDVGLIGMGKEKIEHFTIGLVPTLVRRDLSNYSNKFGLIISDECHHLPAKSFTDVISQFKAFYRYGVTATPYREDQLEALMYYSVGPELARLEKSTLRRNGNLITPTVIRKLTNFDFNYQNDYSQLEDAVVEDEARNNQITKDVVNEASDPRNTCIVLVNRINHGEILSKKIGALVKQTGFVHSKMTTKQVDEVLDAFEQGQYKVLIATYTMLAEGFDYKPSNRLFLTAPVKGRSRIEQACGRVERVAPGKTGAIVYDYVDIKMGVLARQAEVRLDVYENDGNPVYTQD